MIDIQTVHRMFLTGFRKILDIVYSCGKDSDEISLRAFLLRRIETVDRRRTDSILPSVFRYSQCYYRFLLTFHSDKYVEARVLLYCKLRSRSREYLNSRYLGWISRDWDYRFGTSAVPRWRVCEQTPIYFMANYAYLWYTRLNICNKPTNFVKWSTVSLVWESALL